MVAFQLPNWVEAAITFYACTMLGVVLVPMVHFYGPKEVGFILRQIRARALVVVEPSETATPAELATIRDDLPDLEHVIIVRRPRRPARARRASAFGRCSTLRRSPPRSRSTPTRRPSSATHPAPPPIPREWCIATAPSASRCASWPSTRMSQPAQPDRSARRARHRHARRVAVPAYRWQPIHMIDGWDPPRCSRPWSRSDISAGSGSTYFFTSLLRLPRLRARARRADALHRPGRLADPDAVAERADELGISLVRSYGCTEHPSMTGSEHEAPRRSASTPTAGRSRVSRSGRSTRTVMTSASASRARS